MKQNKSVLLAFLLLVLTASLYRVWGGRPQGFAPQLAMAIFGGAVIQNKKLALFLPLLSMLFSDLVYQVLYVKGLSTIPGFYAGQVENYALIAGLTCFGFLMKKVTALRVLGFAISGSLLFFLLSNFSVWLAGAGFHHPKTFDGLLACYGDALVFYRDYGLIHGFAANFILGDIFFCFVLFGTYELLNRYVVQPKRQLA
jgi:hypothetical protein